MSGNRKIDTVREKLSRMTTIFRCEWEWDGGRNEAVNAIVDVGDLRKKSQVKGSGRMLNNILLLEFSRVAW